MQGDLTIGSNGTTSDVRAHLLTAEQNQLDLIPLTPVNITMSYSREQGRFIRSKYHTIVKLCPHPEEQTNFAITMLM